MLCIVRLFPFFILLLVINVYSYAESLLSVKNIEQRPFSLSAGQISTWKKEGIRVFVASNSVEVRQKPFSITADTVVCWFHEDESMQRREAAIEVYCEGNVTIIRDDHFEKYEQVYLRFYTMTGIVVNPELQPIETFEEPLITGVVLRGEEIRARKEEEYLSTDMPEEIHPDEIPEEEEIIDILADHIDSWLEDKKRVIVALGNVRISKGDTTLEADNVVLWLDLSESDDSDYLGMPLTEVYAEGNVTIRRKEDTVIADKIFENRAENKGIYLNSQIKTTPFKDGVRGSGIISMLEDMPFYIGGDEILLVGERQYEVTNATITTCGYGHPHYHFKGRKIRLVQREASDVVSSWHNTFHIDRYPVAYFPYLYLDVRKRNQLLRDWQFGSSSRFGSFIRTDWDLFAITGGEQKDWSDLVLSLDYLSKRGPGAGLDFEYRRHGMSGLLSTYYIRDYAEFDINDVPIDQKDRGTILWRHRQELPYDMRLDMEYSYLSDPRFLREYFPHEFKQEKDRETVLYFRRIHNTTAQTFLVNKQFHGFDTTVDSLREKRYVERLPEVTYRILGEPIGDNNFIFTSESSVTNFGSTIDLADDPVNSQSLVRADTVNRITMPFKPGFFNINPFVEGRVTGYTESVNTSGTVDEPDGPAAVRFIGSFGFDWNSTHWRTYSVYNDLFKINRLRHIFVPELRYVYSPIVTKDPDKLIQHDEIDEKDSSQVVVFGVKNKLQTKRGAPGFEKTVDFLEFNIDYYLFPTNAGLFTDGINGIIIREDNFINLDFRAQLTDVVAYVSERNEFNTERFRFDTYSSGLELNNMPNWQYFIVYRFIRDISSNIALGADYRISEKWRVMAAERYDFRSLTAKDVNGETAQKTRNLSTQFALFYYFHDWVASVSLELDAVRDDRSYRFDIVPRGLERTVRRFWF
ncbi:MAG: LPS assembly protein LptD [Candidatus Loosdrechtia sp.]|uniref:LPS assembly protein LptD n=1 Tax=Candidatus Loosdrechtia sp. TaxID=3101272 RepID=UPI003A79891D|nr:MAG: LPS assembly protein LptD [Candidatus Jettenia sp. AMX2]